MVFGSRYEAVKNPVSERALEKLGEERTLKVPCSY